MTARRPLLWMLPVVALLGFVSTSASWLDAFSAPTPDEFARNYQRWRSLDDAERRVIVARWEAWQALDVDEQRVLEDRMLTLLRVRATVAEQAPAEGVSAATLADEVERLVALARLSVEAHDADPAEVRRALNHRSRKLALAYVDDLIELGKLAPERRVTIEALDTHELVSRALALAKEEAVAAARAARLHDDAPIDDPEELEVLEPLDVVRRVERMRELYGFHGPIGRLVHERMDDDERRLMRAASEAGRDRDVRALLVPHIRAIGEARGVPGERIDRIVELPRGAMERHLNALLSASR